MYAASRGTSPAHYSLNPEPHQLMQGNRIVGYDLARALAFLGMLLVNYSVLLGNNSPDTNWLDWSVGIITGRAAATFVVLAGAGLSLLSKGLHQSNYGTAANRKRNLLLKRSLFLLIIGLLNLMMSPISDILHFYAVYIAIGACLLTVSNRDLLVLSLATIGSRPLVVAFFDVVQKRDLTNITDISFLNLTGIIGHFLFNGCFPVMPWMAFVMMGMWIGRQNLSDRVFRKKFLFAGFGAVVVAESLSRMFIFLSSWEQFNPKDLQTWFAISASEPMPLFMVSAMGTAMVFIGLSVTLAEKCRNARWILPFVAVGQTTLTLYVSHIVVGSLLLLITEELELESCFFHLWATIVFYLGALLFSQQWMNRCKKGPLELLMRRFLIFSGKSGTSLHAKAPL